MNKYILKAEFQTVDQARRDGRESGIAWDASWAPGGPFVCRDRFGGHDEEWNAYCDFTVACNKAWIDGWRAGRKEATGEENDN